MSKTMRSGIMKMFPKTGTEVLGNYMFEVKPFQCIQIQTLVIDVLYQFLINALANYSGCDEDLEAVSG